MEYTCIHLKTIISSEFAHHLLEGGHSFGKISDIMEVLHFSEKGGIHGYYRKKCCIYWATESENQLNDKHTVSPIKTLETKHRKESHLTGSSFQPPPM
jgi:hypothetical protein